jgi:hypothetical protein
MMNKVQLQFYFNCEEKLAEIETREEKVKFLQTSLMTRGREFHLKLSYKDHQRFLEYWNET